MIETTIDHMPSKTPVIVRKQRRVVVHRRKLLHDPLHKPRRQGVERRPHRCNVVAPQRMKKEATGFDEAPLLRPQNAHPALRRLPGLVRAVLEPRRDGADRHAPQVAKAPHARLAPAAAHLLDKSLHDGNNLARGRVGFISVLLALELKDDEALERVDQLVERREGEVLRDGAVAVVADFFVVAVVLAARQHPPDLWQAW